MIPMQEQHEYNNRLKDISKHLVGINLPDSCEKSDDDDDDDDDVGGSGDEENNSGRDPGGVHNKIGLILTASHVEKLQELMKSKKQKGDEKKLRAAEKEEKDKADALVLHTLKSRYLAEYNACSPDGKANFALVRLSKVTVPDLVKIYKAFTGKGRGDLSSRDLLLKAIMEQIRK